MNRNALDPVIRAVRPTDPALADILDRHLSLMRASSPACSVHAMDANDMADADVSFFAAFDGDTAIAMGALKRVTEGHGELKSMHVLQDRRGGDLADRMLARLLEEARSYGFERVSLETGSQPPFAPARAFYLRNGFAFCGPFEGYVEDPHSVFMTRTV